MASKNRYSAIRIIFFALLLILAGCSSSAISPSSLLFLDDFSVAPTTISKGNTFAVKWAVTADGPYNFDFYISKISDASTEAVRVFSFSCSDAPLLPCSAKGGEVTCLFSQNAAGSLSVGCGEQSAALPWTGNLYAVGTVYTDNAVPFQIRQMVSVVLKP